MPQFQDAGIRKKILWFRDKVHFITCSNNEVSESSPPCSSPLRLNCHGATWCRPTKYMIHNGEQDKTGIRRSGNPDPLKRAISKPATSLHPGEGAVFMILDCKQSCPFAPEERYYFFFQGYQWTINLEERQTPTKACYSVHETWSTRNRKGETVSQYSSSLAMYTCPVVTHERDIRFSRSGKRLVLWLTKGSKTYSILHSKSYYVCFFLS